MVNAMRHTDPLERLHHAILVLHCGHLVAIGEWQFDILIHGEIANEIEALKDETNFLIANARAAKSRCSTPGTARNWNSVTKMLEMAEEMEAQG